VRRMQDAVALGPLQVKRFARDILIATQMGRP